MRISRYVSIVIVLCPLALAAGDTEKVDPLRAKQFIVMGYQGLLSDLAAGRGPYLNTLFDLLHVASDQRAAQMNQIRSLAQRFPNIMDFADHLLEPYPAAPATAPSVIVSTPSPTLVPLSSSAHVFTGDALENALGHLGKGMKVTVYLKTGAQVTGTVNEYDARRLWIRSPSVQSFKLDEIRAIEAPEL